MQNIYYILIPAVLAATLAPAAWAGKGKHERKEEFWDGNCKVEREWKKNGDYKEERECKGGRPAAAAYPHVVVSPTPAVMVQPPWVVVQHGRPVYQPGWELAPAPAPAPVPSQRPATNQQPVHQCNTATGTAILGGILGGVAGHQIGGGSGKTIATIGGAIAGVLIGGEIGRGIDMQNQACIGQALELAPAGKELHWQDSANPQVQYGVVPGQIEKRGDNYCRPYTAIMVANGRQQQTEQVACRQQDGTWARYQ